LLDLAIPFFLKKSIDFSISPLFSSMAILQSSDEGTSWQWKRYFGQAPKKRNISFSYPSLIQSSNGLIHISYSFKTDEGKTIQHASFNEEWITVKTR